jgi:hypothetical protein
MPRLRDSKNANGTDPITYPRVTASRSAMGLEGPT